METPCVLVDVSIVEDNIRKFQAEADANNIAVRPHIKTHKLPRFALDQLAAGGIGITCQKIGEAEIMVDAGIDNILITYNILGKEKVSRLIDLAKRCTLSVVADNAVVVDGLSREFSKNGLSLKVLVECDTGGKRCGVQTPQAAHDLAQHISQSPGLIFEGLMTYPPVNALDEVQNWLTQAQDLLLASHLNCPVVSSGGSPNMWQLSSIPAATEHRIGTYIYNDRSLVERGICTHADCALTVVATVVSRPTADRAIIDAGSKALTSDLLNLEGYGYVKDAPDAIITALHEEHGIIDLSSTDWDPSVGDLVSIIPNHACVVSNLFDNVILIENDGSRTTQCVSARGKVF